MPELPLPLPPVNWVFRSVVPGRQVVGRRYRLRKKVVAVALRGAPVELTGGE